MTNSLGKTTVGILWSSAERVASVLLQVLTTLVLARLLTPSDFGIVGILLIFSLLSDSFVDGGLIQALIRKSKVSQEEYSSVFFLNILVSIFLYLLLFVFSRYISFFFQVVEVEVVSYYFFLVIPINAFGLIQTAILTKELKFSQLAKISIISTFISGIFSVITAYKGYGIWAIVCQYVLNALVKTTLLWLLNNWRPSLVFNLNLINPLFKFGYNLVIISLMNTGFNSVYNFFIGRFHTKNDLGYYSYSNQLVSSLEMFSTSVVQRVTYPVMAKIRDDKSNLKLYYSKVVRLVMFLNFPLLFFLTITSKPIFSFFFSDKWINSAPIFSILCFSGAFRFLTNIAMNMFKIEDKTRELLYIELLGKFLSLFTILISFKMSLLYFVLGKGISSILIFALYTYFIYRIIGIGIGEQLTNILDIFIVSLVVCIPVGCLCFFFENGFICILLSFFLYFCLYGFLAYFFLNDMFSYFRVFFLKFMSKFSL